MMRFQNRERNSFCKEGLCRKNDEEEERKNAERT